MAANTQRGEIDITLGGKDYVLRPSFDAIAKIEARLGKGIYGLCTRWICSSDIGMGEAAVIVEECIKAYGDLPPDNIGQLIRVQGFSKLVTPLMKLLGNAIRGDEPSGGAEGEAQGQS